MITNNTKKTIGILGMAISVIGVIFSLKKRNKFLAGVFALTFIVSGYVFFTGTTKYATIMWNETRMKMSHAELEDYLKTQPPVIEIESPEKLKEKLEKRDRFFLWLPCEHGGAWYKQSKFLYTKWTLPKNDVVCPSGRVLIKYGKSS